MSQALAQPSRQEPPEIRLTLEDWANLPEDEPGELVDGRVVEEEVPDYAHEMIVIWLGRHFSEWLDERGSGFVGGSDAKFAVRKDRGRKPDLTVYLPGGRIPPRRGIVRVAPDIMVEIITSTPRDTRRDRVEKTAEYATFGVRWYWLVDPERRTLEILGLGESGLYTLALAAADGVLERIPGCEGLTLDLSALWEKLDTLAESDSAAE